MNPLSSFRILLQVFSPVMTAPSFNRWVTLLTGWLFARRHTVTGLIMAAQAVGAKRHSSFHRVFAAARWSRDELGLALFQRIRPWTGETVMLVLDDTLTRKRGRKVFGAGMHHDPLLSSRRTTVTNYGHSWVVLGVLVRLPLGRQRWFCLPILCRLYLNKKSAAKHRRCYRTQPELAVQLLHKLFKTQRYQYFRVVADSAYGGRSVLCHLPGNCHLTRRLPLDARLYDPPSPRQPGTSGRPRKRGPRLASPQQMLDPRCRRQTLKLYDRKTPVRLDATQARRHVAPDCELTVVAVEPLRGERGRQAFFSTDATADSEQVLAGFASRGSIEVCFHDAKQHLGFEQPQGWTRKAVERTAPMALLLYSLIVLWFAETGHAAYQAPTRPWYPHKPHASFADRLATLRMQTIREQFLQTPSDDGDRQKWLDALGHAWQQAP